MGFAETWSDLGLYKRTLGWVHGRFMGLKSVLWVYRCFKGIKGDLGRMICRFMKILGT